MYIKKIILLLISVLFCINIAAQNVERDTPREGEGINGFLLRNKRSINEYRNAFIELNKGKFGKDNSLLKGVKYILPPLNKNKAAASATTSSSTNKVYKEPLFGKKYEDYTIKSNVLQGTTFYLSSGHGGPDCGAIGKAEGKELHEDEYAYDIMLRLARNLKENGAIVDIIIQDAEDGIRDDRFLSNSNRETCMGEPIPINQSKRLKQRANKINELSRKSKNSYQRSIFIHLDSRSENKKIDVFFYHSKNSKKGKELANTMRSTFDHHYNLHQKGRGYSGTVSTRNLYVLDYTNPVGLYVELGNIRNTLDQRRFIDPNQRQALANWLYRGFLQDYENSKNKK